LFSGYFFVRVVDQWRAIERCLGVDRILRFGPEPARCPDVEVAKLIDRADADGVVRLSRSPPRSAIRPGSKMLVIAGPFAGFDALYVGQGAHERELVLLHVLSGQRQVAIDAALLAPRQ
jgi:transcription antitermination factor NusG